MNINFDLMPYNKQLDISICLSNVLKEKADACIVPQYPTKASTSGISNDLLKKATKDSILAYQNEASQKRVPYGSVRITSCSGNNYKYLIHISSLGLNHHSASFETLYFCVRIALKQADKEGFNSIVIPAINTGKTQMLSYNEAALGTLKAIFDIKHELKCLTKVKIVLKNSDAYKIYNETLDLLSN